jgi:OOP family OmpA-OmpF porin
MIGYTFNTKSYLPLENYPIGGLEFQYNIYNSKISPEFSFYYERGTYDIENSYALNIYTLALRGVYTFKGSKQFQPFAKVGLSDRILTAQHDEFRTALFLDLGTGFKMPLNDTTALKLELLSSFDHNNEQYNYHFTILAGLSFSFEKLRAPIKRREVHNKQETLKHKSYKNARRYMNEPKTIKPKITKHINEQKPEPEPILEEIVQKDSDNDGILDDVDNCLNTSLGVKVTADGCEVIEPKEELVLEELILEPDEEEPYNEKIILEEPVEKVTLPVKSCEDEIFKKIANLQINFKYKSTQLTLQTQDDLQLLSKFLKEKRAYNIKVIGYTDNVASKHYNKRLSKKRANAVKSFLVNEGIDAQRITTLGLGEAYPIATNRTAEGRAKNRRIELILVHID